MIRAVFFDAGDVLYTRASSSTELAHRLLADSGYAARIGGSDEAELADLRRQASTGKVGVRAYWEEVLRHHGVRPADSGPILAGIDEFADEVIGAPRAREVLSELRRRGFSLGVITDTMYPLERKMRWLERIGVADLIDVISCSTALGVKKPDPAIYRDALDRAGVPATDAAFVAHAAEELTGAQAVGMATIAIHPDAGAVADRTIATLPDLLDLEMLQRAAP